MGALDEVKQISVQVIEKNEAIALSFERLTDEVDTLGLEGGVGGIEIVIGNGQMPNPAVFVVGGGLWNGQGPISRDDFQHGAIFSPDEVISGVGVVDVELEMIHIPLGELLRVGRRDRGVFNSLEHKTRL